MTYGCVAGEYDIIKEIILPETLIEIVHTGFHKLGKVEKITVSSSIKSIGPYFSEFYNVRSIIFRPNSQLTSIGFHFLVACNRLETLVLPSLVNSIVSFGFLGARRFRRLYYFGQNDFSQQADLLIGSKIEIFVTPFYPSSYFGCIPISGIFTLINRTPCHCGFYYSKNLINYLNVYVYILI